LKVLAVIPEYAAPVDDPCCYPLGFAYIIAEVKKQFTVDVCNLNLGHTLPDFKNYDAVMTHGFPESARQIYRVAELAKQAGIRSVLGGGMATYYPRIMQNAFNSVIVGEGESEAVRAILADGIYYGKPIDLKTVHRPDYEAIGIDEYHQKHGWRYMGILGSRGCPHACTFCANICSFRVRPIADIAAELDDYQRQYRLEHLVVYDNTLNVSRGRLRRFTEMMHGRGLSWSACLRTDNIEEEDVVRARDAGLNYALIGIESLRQEKLDAFNKKAKVEDTYKLLGWLDKHRVKFVGGVFLATDDDTMDDVVTDIRLMRDSGYNLAPNTLTEFPGTLAKRSPHFTPAEHKNIADLCGDFRIEKAATFGRGFQRRQSAVVGMVC